MSGQIRSAIVKMAGQSDAMQEATVQSVDIASRTCICSAITGNASIEITARLMAEVDDGFLLVPTVGSTVIVSYSKAVAPYISLFSQVDKVVLISGDYGLEINADGVKINDGSDGGLVKVKELTDRLNKLEDALGDLISKFNTHTHAGVTTGSGVSGTTATPSTKTVTQTDRADLENTTVTHGKGL